MVADMDPALAAQLPQLLPLAAKWVEEQERVILSQGVALDLSSLELAKRVGVREPERIRLRRVIRIVPPHEPTLFRAAVESGLITEHTGGLTLGYGILIRADCWGLPWLIAHECKHVEQYERLGIAGFLQAYLLQCVQFGYPDAPLEQEAIRAEQIAR